MNGADDHAYISGVAKLFPQVKQNVPGYCPLVGHSFQLSGYIGQQGDFQFMQTWYSILQNLKSKIL